MTFANPPTLRVLPLLAVLLLAGALVGAGALPAAAHARLLASTPTDGATLDEAPPEIVLEFNEPVEAEFGQLQVFDPSGERIDAGAPESDGAVVRSELLAPRAAGTHTVAFRIISADGHPVEGSFTFELTEAAVQAQATVPATPPPPDAPADDADAATEAEATPDAPQEDATPVEDGEDLTAAQPDEDGGLPWLTIAFLLVVVLAVAAIVLSRRGGPADAAGTGGASSATDADAPR